jgi:hypothetical protein
MAEENADEGLKERPGRSENSVIRSFWHIGKKVPMFEYWEKYSKIGTMSRNFFDSSRSPDRWLLDYDSMVDQRTNEFINGIFLGVS